MDVVTFVKYFRGREINISVSGYNDEPDAEVRHIEWEGTNHDIYQLPADHVFHRLKVDRATIRFGVLQISCRTAGQAK